MQSSLPKVLHPLAGKAMLLHVIDCAVRLEPIKIHIVVGHGAAQIVAEIETKCSSKLINWVEQKQQNGTGHAVAQAIEDIDENSTVLVMAGDVPLIEPQTALPLTQATNCIHLLTAVLDDPSGLGRIVRQYDGQVSEIVEHKDATPEQLKLTEINTGILAMPAKKLADWLGRLNNDNAQDEYYLTDIVSLAHQDNISIKAAVTDDPVQVAGVNSRRELARLERVYQLRQAQYWMTKGVGFADPGRVDFRGSCEFGQDVWVDVNVIFEGSVNIASNIKIGPNTIIKNSSVDSGCEIEANSVVDNAEIGKNCKIGPFARIRPGTQLAANAKIGNFVEIKKSFVGEGSKVNHLSYVGDSLVGQNVNIGAGVITCNYDGANKHQTTIGDDVLVGSDCQLVAPVNIGDGATIGAGSTIVKNVPGANLSLSRSPQKTIEGWQRPKKTRT